MELYLCYAMAYVLCLNMYCAYFFVNDVQCFKVCIIKDKGSYEMISEIQSQ